MLSFAVRPAFAKLIVTALVTTSISSTSGQSSEWLDPAGHATRFVSVDKDVRLEVLDWGGEGRAVVLLPGLGNTAHVFDDFAPKLLPKYHVYAITRRGFGASTIDASDFSADRLGRDVLAVLDSLEIPSPVVVGHSIAGQELSYLASTHRDRIAGLVYIDAAYRYAFVPAQPEDAGQPPNPGPPLPPPPQPRATDLVSVDAYSRWSAHFHGFILPEAEVRATRLVNTDGSVGPAHASAAVRQAIAAGGRQFSNIAVPALALFAVPHDPGPWSNDDPTLRDTFAAAAEFDKWMTGRQATAFERNVARARVIRLPGTHYLFLSNTADVLREVTSFIDSLQSSIR